MPHPVQYQNPAHLKTDSNLSNYSYENDAMCKYVINSMFILTRNIKATTMSNDSNFSFV